MGLVAAVFLAGCSQQSPPVVEPTPGAAAPSEPVVEPPLFEDITSRSNIRFTYRNGEDTADHYSILESLGGGVGLIDFDGDGLLDVFLPGGGWFEGADKRSIVGAPCKLYRNLGGTRFEDATATAGLEKLAGGRPWFYTHGVAVADFDRDGWPDLLVTGWGGVALFRNTPADPAHPAAGRRFEDITGKAGLANGVTWATSAAFADLDGDGYPDLYVCQYVDWSWHKHPSCHYDGKTPDVCPPREFHGLTHKLYRNNTTGGFVDVGSAAGLVPGGPTQSKGLGVAIADLDGDGKPDIAVANDTVDNFLYMNKSRPGSLLFEERGLVSGVARDDRGNANGSMGIDFGDPERLGKPALWVTNYENELHALYRNESAPGHPFFQFRSAAAGIGAIGQRFVSWGTAFLDADLDGWEDLFIANGHAIRQPTGKNSSRKQQPAFLLNRSGKLFVEANSRIGEYFKTPRLARGIAVGDLDNDGRPDVVISHLNEPVTVLRGIGSPGRHWIGVRLEGRDRACTVGATVKWESAGVRQTRFAKAGCSYASSGDRRHLFGLGSETAGRLIVVWPDGTEQTFENLSVDRYYHITHGAAVAELEPGQTP